MPHFIPATKVRTRAARVLALGLVTITLMVIIGCASGPTEGPGPASQTLSTPLRLVTYTEAVPDAKRFGDDDLVATASDVRNADKDRGTGAALASPDVRPATAHAAVCAVGNLPSWEDVADQLDEPTGTPWHLSARECRQLAADRATASAALDIERRLANCLRPGTEGSCEATLVTRLIELDTKRQRNEASRQALLAYYGLAEVFAQRELLADFEAEVRRLSDVISGVRASGISANLDSAFVQLRRIELLRQRSGLFRNQNTLNHHLAMLLDADPRGYQTIVPECQFQVPQKLGDLDVAMSLAFQFRPELQAIQIVRECCHDRETLVVVREFLQSSDRFLGQNANRGVWLSRMLAKTEACAESCCRCAQLDELAHDMRRTIGSEVAAAHFTAAHRLQRIVLADQEMREREAFVARLEAKRLAGNLQYNDLAQARLEWLVSRASRLHEVAMLQVDLVNLEGVIGR